MAVMRPLGIQVDAALQCNHLISDTFAQQILNLTANHASARGYRNGHFPSIDYVLSAVGDGFRSPTPLFDPIYYLAHLPPSMRRETSPLRHYFEVGAAAQIAPAAVVDLDVMNVSPSMSSLGDGEIPALLRILQNVEPPFLQVNALFDAEVYLSHLPTGASEGMSPFEHFLLCWTEFRVPFSRVFDIDFYTLINPHINNGRINPLCHYFSLPVDQRTDANPMIHSKYYAHTHRAVTGDPLVHFVRYGLDQGAAPNPYAFRELRLEPTHLPPEHVRERLLNYISRA